MMMMITTAIMIMTMMVNMMKITFQHTQTNGRPITAAELATLPAAERYIVSRCHILVDEVTKVSKLLGFYFPPIDIVCLSGHLLPCHFLSIHSLPLYPSIHFSLTLSLYLYLSLFHSLFLCLSLYLSLCLSLCLSLSPSHFLSHSLALSLSLFVVISLFSVSLKNAGTGGI